MREVAQTPGFVENEAPGRIADFLNLTGGEVELTADQYKRITDLAKRAGGNLRHEFQRERAPSGVAGGFLDDSGLFERNTRYGWSSPHNLLKSLMSR